MHIKNSLTVFLDTEKEETIQIGKYEADEPKTQEELKNMVLLDIATLTEALVVTIRSAHQLGIKVDSDSMRDVIQHLESGFVDSQLNVETPQYEIPDHTDWKGSYEDLLKYRRGRSKH